MKKKIGAILLTVALVVGLSIPMAIAPAVASPAYIETLYLSDTGTGTDGTSTLYEVVINTVDNRAELTPLPNGMISFNHADAIACTPDGLFIYCIDDSASQPCTRRLGVYDVTLATFTDLGLITTDGTTAFKNTDQAAFSTGGTLYITRNEDDKLYTLDIDSSSPTYLQVSAVGTIKKDGSYPVDIGGADIVFDENDVCYLWTFWNRTNAPRGLYTFPEPTTTGDITATWCNPSASVNFTGMAIRGGGAGDLIGSRTDTNKISVIDKTTGAVTPEYPMMTFDGSSWVSFDQQSGDMTVGELAVEEGKCGDLIAGQHIDVGDVIVWDDGTNLYVTYEITEPDWVITETHLYVGQTDPNADKNGNPLTSAPGQFPYDDDDATSVTDTEVTYEIPLGDIDGYHMQLNKQGNPTGVMVADGTPGVTTCNCVYIAAQAEVMDISCYETAIVYGIERYTGTVYGVDVLTGTSWMEFDTTSPPVAGSATPNGLAYDAENERFYYCDYYSPNGLYFWDTSQHVAGNLTGNVADAGFYDGKYYYITGPPASDDLYEVAFNTDGTIAAGYPLKIDDIADNEHGWTFNGDIAVKDGVIYGWGLCSSHGYEFFTYDLDTGVFNVYSVSYSSSLQLGFGTDGTLYGHRSGGAGAFYVIDTTNGSVSMVTPTPSPVHLYTDCASGMICEPVTETAWGWCDENGEEFPGANWATYMTYHVGGGVCP